MLLPALYLLSLLINSTEDDMMWYASGSFAKGRKTLSSMVTGIVFPGLSGLVWEVRNSCSSKVVATVGVVASGMGSAFCQQVKW